MDKKLPFGDLNKDLGRQRLLCVGIGSGMIIGALGSQGTVSRIIIATFGIALVVVRYLAQKHWPDQLPNKDL